MLYQRKVLLAGLCLLLLFLTGCLNAGRISNRVLSEISNRTLSGYLFTKIKVPYTVNLDNTPAVLIPSEGKILQVSEPFSGYGLNAKVGSNAIGDIARIHGLNKVYFADLEIFSILGGIWRHEKIIIYGE
jgi:hypothetical protein